MSAIFLEIAADDSIFWLQSYAENLKAPNIFHLFAYYLCF